MLVESKQHMLGSVRVSNKHYPQDRILIKYVNLQILYAINIVTVAKIQCQRHSFVDPCGQFAMR